MRPSCQLPNLGVKPSVKPLSLMALLVASAAFAGQPPVERLLVIGDSISKHQPNATLGWEGNWGMAASSEDKDYVHLFLARLAASQAGKEPELLICAEGGGTLAAQAAQCERFKAFGADLAIVQMGENDNKEVDEAGFQRPYEEILEAIKAGNPKARILCAGVWTPPYGSAAKDALIRKACEKTGAVFVDLGSANSVPANKAGSENRFSHPGVNWHPGDKGMQAYADALWLGWTDPKRASQPSLSATAGPTTLLLEEKWDGKSELKWKPEPDTEKGTLKLTSDNADVRVGTEIPLPADRCTGRLVIVETRVRGENLSEKPQPHNGVKLMLLLKNAEGEDNFPQADIPVGTFDWKPVRWTLRMPDNIVSAKLRLGMENITGTAWFEPIKISIAE